MDARRIELIAELSGHINAMTVPELQSLVPFIRAKRWPEIGCGVEIKPDGRGIFTQARELGGHDG